MRLLALGVVLSLGVHPARAQISPEEARLLESLDPSRTLALMKLLSEDVVENRSGAGAGTAVAGSGDEKLLADFIEREMAGLGFDVRRESFPVRAYDSGEVTLLASGARIPAVTLHTSLGTWGTVDGVPYRRGSEDEGRKLRATLLEAGDGLAADYDRASDVRGKAVLVRRTLWPSYAIVEAAHRGASAILFHGYGENSIDEALKQDSVWYRLLSYEPSGWVWEYGQQPRPVDVDLYDVYREVASKEAAARIAKLEAQAEAHLREALFIVTGRLEESTRALAKTPVPRGGTQ
jgi:hypothetical protein